MTVHVQTPGASALLERFTEVRRRTERLAAPLTAEDQLLQSMPEASPTKWHRAHTTWFFETFVLAALGEAPGDARRAFLWNSYYEAIGARHPRPRRGLLSRPGAEEVGAYRREIDERVTAALTQADDARRAAVAPLIELGLAHEEQHQELILTDILHAFSLSPLAPTYREHGDAGADARARPGAASGPAFAAFDGGLVTIGRDPEASGFTFDNEGPRHKVWLEPFELATRPVTVGEVRAFIAEGGYRTPALWLSAGWDLVCADGLDAPLYTELADGALRTFTLHGWRSPADDEPASHLSYYEADAIARFLGGRLPSEAEWELAAATDDPHDGHLLDASSPLHPRADHAAGMRQLFGDVWEWTRSAYAPYPSFAPGPGAIGEYNGKFMVGQQVLRGGSCLTPRGHMRASYRNFWPPQTRFQMSGLRLARDRR